MSAERKSFGERVAEFSKRLDVIQIIGGLGIAVFNPAVGFVIVGGSAVTYYLADRYQKSQKEKKAAGYA